MNTLKILWKRFWAKTPAFLARVRNFCLVVAGALGAMIPILNQSPVFTKYTTVMGIIATVLASIAAGLQFATSNPDIQQMK